MNLSKQLMIGLPGAGKSTFLAALWQVITSSEVSDSLELIKLNGDTSYIDRIHQKWLTGNEVGRTSLASEGAEEKVTMLLGKSGIAETEISFPDLSGEIFDLQWVDREWAGSYDNVASSASGIILFLNPKTIVSGEMITPTVEGMIEKIIDTEEQDDEEDEEEEKEFDPLESPTQVKMVALLQFIDEKDYLDHLKNIALVVSSWDIAMKNYLSPEIWLNKELPFLDQFLKNNSHRFKYTVYGISGQGGELADRDGNRIAEADKLEPVNKIV